MYVEIRVIQDCGEIVTSEGNTVHLEENTTHFLKRVDVREDREWIQGHIPGAIHLGKGIIERDIEKVIEDKENLIVLYCQGGFRSALAGENLKKMGYKKILSMQGGFGDWVNNKYPVEVPN